MNFMTIAFWGIIIFAFESCSPQIVNQQPVNANIGNETNINVVSNRGVTMPKYEAESKKFYRKFEVVKIKTAV